MSPLFPIPRFPPTEMEYPPTNFACPYSLIVSPLSALEVFCVLAGLSKHFIYLPICLCSSDLLIAEEEGSNDVRLVGTGEQKKGTGVREKWGGTIKCPLAPSATNANVSHGHHSPTSNRLLYLNPLLLQ